MSFTDGWAAINLEMPKRVPRTEFSVTINWDLIEAVTGTRIDHTNTYEEHLPIWHRLFKAWNYDLWWSVGIGAAEFGNLKTDMGHAAYMADGVDKRAAQSSPFKGPEDVLAFDPWQAFGKKDPSELIRRFEDHYQENRRLCPDAVNMSGTYISLVSGLIDLFGWDLLLTACGMDPVAFGDLTNRYATWIQQYFDALAASHVPVAMVHDDMVWTQGAIFHPDWYRTYVFPNYRKLIAPLLDAGKRILFTSDGTYTDFFDDIVQCGFHGVVLEPTNDMAAFAEKYGQTHVFIGNADTRILLSGSRAQIRAEVERCMAIGKKCPGYFMCVGNHIPPNTPVQNALYYNQVYEDLGRR